MGKTLKEKIITSSMENLNRMGEKKCQCGEDRIEKLTVDHIVPVQILKDFGLSMSEMYQLKFLKVMCRQCNALKANHLDFKDQRTKEILLDLINNYL